MGGAGNVTLRGVGGVVIDCGGTGPIYVAQNNGNDTISGFVFMNVVSNQAAGGTLDVLWTSLAIRDTIFINCQLPVAFTGDLGQNTSRGTLEITNCSFISSVHGPVSLSRPQMSLYSGNGTALMLLNALTVRIVGSTFTNSYSQGSGGAIYMWTALPVSTVWLSNSTFTNSRADYNGGAMYMLSGTLNIDSCVFRGGYAKFGGGVVMDSGNLNITRTIFDHNTAVSGMGHLGVYGCPLANVYVFNTTFSSGRSQYIQGAAFLCGLIQDSTFYNNSAACGVNLKMNGGLINNTLFTGNSVDKNGGSAMQMNGGRLLNSRIYHNGFYAIETQYAGVPCAYVEGCDFAFNLGTVIILSPFITFNVTNTSFRNNTYKTATDYAGSGAIWANGMYMTLGVYDCYFYGNGFYTNVDTGTCNGAGIDAGGGAVVTVSGSTFVSNGGSYGGAIAASDYGNGKMTITDSTFIGNSAINRGGAIACTCCTLEMSDCVFDSNGVLGNYFIEGGAVSILNSGGPALPTRGTRLTFRNNYSYWYGGAIAVDEDNDVLVTDSTFVGNSARVYGPAIYLNYPSNTTFINCVITDNNNYNNIGAGAIDIANGANFTLLNSVVERNHGIPSAISCQTPLANKYEFNGNVVTQQLGPSIQGCAPAGIANCGACLYGSCNPVTGACDCFTWLPTKFANCTAAGGCLGNGSCTWYVNSVTGNDVNNGSTPTSAFMTITNALLIAKAGDIINLAGTFPGFTLIRAVSIVGPASITCTAGQSITVSMTAANDTVVFDSLTITSCPISITNGRTTIRRSMIVGPASINASTTTLTFVSSNLIDTSTKVTSSSLNLTATSIRTSMWAANAPLAIRAISSNVVLSSGSLIAYFRGNGSINGTDTKLWLLGGSVISGSQNSAGGGNGGAVALWGASNVTIDSSTLKDNSASGFGGAIYVGARASLYICGATVVSGNSAQRGGGIYATAPPTPTCRLNFTPGTVIANNTAALSGGGIEYHNCDVALTGVTVSGNRVLPGGVFGGGLYSATSSAYLFCLTVTGNAAPAGAGVYTTTDTLFFMKASVVRGNSASNSGGGAYADTAYAQFTDCNVDSNTATNGGGIASVQPLGVSGGSLSGNTVSQDGAAINISGGSLSLTSTLVSFNIAPTDYISYGGSAVALVANNGDHYISHVNGTGNIGGLGAFVKMAASGGSTSICYSSVTGNVGGSAIHAAATVQLSMRGSTIASNTGWYGGISLARATDVNIDTCLIEANTASSTGSTIGAGGITCLGCQVAFLSTTITNNRVASGGLGAGFACVSDGYIPTLQLITTTFSGNIDEDVPGLEADFTACGGCSVRSLVLSVSGHVMLNTTAGVGCVPTAHTSCAYTCALDPYFSATSAITCTGTPGQTAGPPALCLLPTTCPLLVAGHNMTITQPPLAGNSSLAFLQCDQGTILTGGNIRTCSPPYWLPRITYSCDPPPPPPAPPAVPPPPPPMELPPQPPAAATTDVPQAIQQTPPPASSITVPLIAGIAGAFGALILFFGCVVFWLVRRRKRPYAHQYGGADVTVKADGLTMAQLLNEMLNSASVIAEGGSGTVYKAKYEGNVVALKVFKENTASASLDYHREVKAFTIFSESSDVTSAVLQLKFISAQPMAIGMEYVEGQSLYDLIRSGSLNERRQLEIIEQLVEALEAFEDRRLAHLDVKTKNILVQKGDTLKLIDYGLTTLTTESSSLHALTGFTPQYVAPEIASIAHNRQRGSLSSSGILDKPLDLHAADTFSFAITLWSLLMLDEPYKGMGGDNVYAALINDPDRRPPVAEGTLAHVHWIELMRECWSTDPALRPSFAQISGRIQQCRESCFGGGEPRRRRVINPNPRTRAEITRDIPPPVLNDPFSTVSSAHSYNGIASHGGPVYGSSASSVGAGLPLHTGASGADVLRGPNGRPISNYGQYTQSPVYGASGSSNAATGKD